MLRRIRVLGALLAAALGLVPAGCGQLPRPDYLSQTMATKSAGKGAIWEPPEDSSTDPKKDGDGADRQ